VGRRRFCLGSLKTGLLAFLRLTGAEKESIAKTREETETRSETREGTERQLDRVRGLEGRGGGGML